MDNTLLDSGNLSAPMNVVALQVFKVLAILLTGLVAGLFYGYDCSVIKGLGNLSDELYLTSFQSINRAILNPYFFMSFTGALMVLPVTTWLSYRTGNAIEFYLLLVATIIYAIGTFGVTLLGNVPLNTMLDQVDLFSKSATHLQEIRQQFEGRWNFLHHLRTYASVLAFLCCILSLLKKL